MSPKVPELSSLPRSVRALIADGVYALYEIADQIADQGASYLLVAGNRAEYYFLSERGDVLPRPAAVRSVADVKLGEPVMLTSESESGVVRVNFGR